MDGTNADWVAKQAALANDVDAAVDKLNAALNSAYEGHLLVDLDVHKVACIGHRYPLLIVEATISKRVIHN